MATFSDWLKSELLRLKFLDWQGLRWTFHPLPKGMGFRSHYSLSSLAKDYGISPDEIIKAVENELIGKQFTLEKGEGGFALYWEEDGIKELKTDSSQEFIIKNEQVPGKNQWTKVYYQTSKMVIRIIYLDCKERVFQQHGTDEPVEVSKQLYDLVMDLNKRANEGG